MSAFIDGIFQPGQYKGREEDEETIGVQLELIRQFMKTRKDLHLAEEYIERGYSGTDFERPEFNRIVYFALKKI